MTLFYLLGTLVVVITCLIIGYKVGRLSIADECLTKGFFHVSGVEYDCLKVFKRDESEYGLPDVLRDEQDNGAFAEGTLPKLKFLKPKARHDLKYKQEGPKQKNAAVKGFEAYAPTKPDRAKDLFGEVKHYDCVQCCHDAKDIQRSMILCRSCGNKRCPKALNHRLTCTHSNAVDQVGTLDKSAPQQTISGSFLFDAVRPDQDVFDDTYRK